MSELTIEQLLDQIDAIDQLYSDHYAQLNDLKALQGLERCVELRMKIWNLTVAQPTDMEPPPDRSIPIVDLPSELLEKLTAHLKNTPMQQQIK